MLDIDDKEDGSIGVLAEDLIDLNIMCFEGIASGIPSYKFLFLADLCVLCIYFAHHIEHGFMVEMIEEPDALLAGIFFERDCVAINYFYIFIADRAYVF